MLMFAPLLSIPYFISVYKHVRIDEEVRADMAIKSEKKCPVVSHVRLYAPTQVKAHACASTRKEIKPVYSHLRTLLSLRAKNHGGL